MNNFLHNISDGHKMIEDDFKLFCNEKLKLEEIKETWQC